MTLTKHVTLGFNANVPITANPNGCLASSPFGCVFSYNVSFSGTARITTRIGADLTMTYDPATLVPGGTVPVQLTYTPTPGGSTLSANLSGTATIDFTGCLNCPAPVAINLASGSGTFTAPLGSAAPVTIPASSSSVSLDDLVSASLSSSLTLAPAPPGSLPGLGGAAAVINVAGASGAPTLPIEWDTSGQSLTTNLVLPATAGGGVDITAGPILHWLGTSGSVNLDLHWGSATQAIFAVITGGISLLTGGLSDPPPINLFSGGLGPVYQSAGLDTQIGNAVGGLAGPLVAARVAAGFVPVPLTQPPLATIPPITLGSTTFSIPGVSISGAPANAILTGTPVNLTANVARGTPPFTFSWTRNGAPFATTQSITDTPTLGATTYGVTVTDSAGAISNTDTVTVDVYDFTVSVTPSDQTVLRGGSAAYTVATAFVPGSAGSATATLSTAGLPGDATTIGLPATLPVGSSSGFTVQTGSSSLGDFAFQVIGTTSAARSGSANLHIFDYIVALSPATETVPQGASATYTLSDVLATGSSLTGVPGSIATSISGLPTGATTTGFPASLTLGTSSTSTVFTVNTATTTPTGTYTLTVTGSTGFGSRTGTTQLVVITVQQAVQNLIDTIDGMGLSKGLETSLGATLNQLVSQINAGKITPVCNKLDAFISKVNNDEAHGKLTAAQAMQLLVQAMLIEQALRC